MASYLRLILPFAGRRRRERAINRTAGFGCRIYNRRRRSRQRERNGRAP